MDAEDREKNLDAMAVVLTRREREGKERERWPWRERERQRPRREGGISMTDNNGCGEFKREEQSSAQWPAAPR
jgi:hypothetical protein